MIRFDDVSVRYPSNERLRLNGASFRIEEGELCLSVHVTFKLHLLIAQFLLLVLDIGVVEEH